MKGLPGPLRRLISPWPLRPPPTGNMAVVPSGVGSPNRLGKVVVTYGSLSEVPPGERAPGEVHLRLFQYDELPSELEVAAASHRSYFDRTRETRPRAVHGTTRSAIRALQRLDLTGKTVLDVGCGEGTLALAAVLLGARQATGFDIDGAIVQVAQRNARLNRCSDRVQFHWRDIREIPPLVAPPDVVVMNTQPELFDHVGGLLEKLPSVRTLIAAGYGSVRDHTVDLPFRQAQSLRNLGFEFTAKLLEHPGRFPLAGAPWSTYVLERAAAPVT